MANVLLICPSLFGYENRIADAITAIGHSVTRVDERVGNGFWDKSLTRLGFVSLLMKKKCAKIAEIDTILVTKNISKVVIISPETLTGHDVAAWKRRDPALSVVVYNWDSQAQKPVTPAMLASADKVFSFDRIDCQNNKDFQYLPLFHCWKGLPDTSITNLYDFSFIGSGRIHRIKLLAQIEKLTKVSGQSSFFYVFAQSGAHYPLFKLAAKFYGFQGVISRKKIDYDTFSTIMLQTRCVIDIEHQRQNGLTIRTIETVFGGQAIATTNSEIRHDEFYKSGAIFILDNQDLSLPSLSELKQTVDPDLFEKYSITNWVRQLVSPAASDADDLS